MVPVCFCLFLAESHLCTRPPRRMISIIAKLSEVLLAHFPHEETEIQQFPSRGRAGQGMRSLWLQGQASLHQASPPLVGSMSSFSPSFIPCPCNPQMLCIGISFLALGLRSQLHSACRNIHMAFQGDLFPQKVQTLQRYSWWMRSQNLRV